jgi:hypothetical protein
MGGRRGGGRGGRERWDGKGGKGERKAHLESTHVDGVECDDDEGAVARGELWRVKPFLVGGCAVPEVDGFPERVVACIGEG